MTRGQNGSVQWVLCAALSLAACSKPPPPPPPVRVPVLDETPTPMADQALREAADDDQDTKWLLGTWKEDGQPTWLLFNPGEAIELQGKPPTVSRRGKLSVHGKYVSAIFDRAELDLEASPDKSELSSNDIRHVYRRGAPP
jgi:hypothetical protein